jgi:hypothetical protein
LLDLYDPLSNRKVDQVAQRVQAQLSHQAGPMSFHGPNANIQCRTDLLVGLALGQELQDLELPRRESGQSVAGVRASDRAVLDKCAGLRRVEGLPPRQRLHAPNHLA